MQLFIGGPNDDTNVIRNNRFDDGLQHWEPINTPTTTLITERFHSGTQCLLIQNVVQQEKYVAATFPTEPGRNYTLRLYYQLQAGQGYVRIMPDLSSATLTQITYPANTWLELNLDFVAARQSTTLYIGTNDTPSTSVYYDSIELIAWPYLDLSFPGLKRTATNIHNHELISFVPQAPGTETQELNNPQGPQLQARQIQNVSQPIDLYFLSTFDQAEASARRLTAVLEDAAAQALKHNQDSRHYLYYRINTNKPLARTAILSGRIRIDSRTLDHQHGQDDRNPRIRATLDLKRHAYWELPLVYLTLSNSNGQTANGLLITNHTAGSDVNYVDVVTPIAGGYPSPPIIELVNNTNEEPNRLNKVFIGLNQTAPLDFNHMLQGQASTLGVVTASASASGGEYITRTWTGAASQNVFNWNLTTEFLRAAQNQPFRLLPYMFTTSSYTDLKYRWWLNIFNLTTLTATEWQPWPANVRLFESGTLVLPPGHIDPYDQVPLQLTLQVIRASGESTTLNLDFLQVLPMDGYRHLTSIGYATGYQASLIDDNRLNITYTTKWPTNPGRLPNYLPLGQPMLLHAGKPHRLYFAMTGFTGTTLNRTAQVLVSYRPRTITL